MFTTKTVDSYSWLTVLLLQLTNLWRSLQQVQPPLDFCFSGKTTHHLQNPTFQICCRSALPIFMQIRIPELLVSQLPVKLSKIKLTDNSMFLSEIAGDSVSWWSLSQVSQLTTVGDYSRNHICGCFLPNLQNKNECSEDKYLKKFLLQAEYK